jgi:hypothetical protein
MAHSKIKIEPRGAFSIRQNSAQAKSLNAEAVTGTRQLRPSGVTCSACWPMRSWTLVQGTLF